MNAGHSQNAAAFTDMYSFPYIYAGRSRLPNMGGYEFRRLPVTPCFQVSLSPYVNLSVGLWLYSPVPPLSKSAFCRIRVPFEPSKVSVLEKRGLVFHGKVSGEG